LPRYGICNRRPLWPERKPSTAHRREVDLYIHTDNIDQIYRRLKGRAQAAEIPHDTFYGMHKLIIRDIDEFWITFGQPIQA
jgi:hypothetical protein